MHAQQWSEDPPVAGMAVLQMSATYGHDVFGDRTQKIVDDDDAGVNDTVEARYAYGGWNLSKLSPMGSENFDFWGVFDAEGPIP